MQKKKKHKDIIQLGRVRAGESMPEYGGNSSLGACAFIEVK